MRQYVDTEQRDLINFWVPTIFRLTYTSVQKRLKKSHGCTMITWTSRTDYNGVSTMRCFHEYGVNVQQSLTRKRLWFPNPCILLFQLHRGTTGSQSVLPQSLKNPSWVRRLQSSNHIVSIGRTRERGTFLLMNENSRSETSPWSRVSVFLSDETEMSYFFCFFLSNKMRFTLLQSNVTQEKFLYFNYLNE